MEETKKKDDRKDYKYGRAPYVIFLIGLMALGATIFGYMETELLNTYIDHVLNLDFIWIGIMVSFSATMGLIFLFIWGVLSDNTRSRFGRRRPFLLIGGIGAGIGMILFGFSPNYAWAFFLDVIIMGIFSNAFYAGQRVLVPDLFEPEYRGRINSYISLMVVIGYILPAVFTLIADRIFAIPNPDPLETGDILTQQGHIFLLLIGGSIIMSSGIFGFFFFKTKIPIDELPPKKNFKEELRATFNIEELKNHREFFKLIIAMTIFMSGVSATLSYLFNFLFSIGIDTDIIIALGMAAPFLLVILIFIGRVTDKIGRKKFIPPIIGVSSIGFIMIPFITQTTEINVFLLGIAMTLILIGLIGVLVPMETWSQDLLPPGKKGQFIGIYNIVNTVSQIFGALTAAIVATALKGVVANPKAWIFMVVPFFFILSIPFFLRVKETLPNPSD
jgi:MFS family permease